MSAKMMGLVWDLTLPPVEKFVLLAVADHADHVGDHVQPGLPLIAKKTDLSPRQIQRTLRRLRARGLLVPLRFATGGRGHVTEYRLDLSTLLSHTKGDIHDTLSVKGDKSDTLSGGSIYAGYVPLKGDTSDTLSAKGDKSDPLSAPPLDALGWPPEAALVAAADPAADPPPGGSSPLAAAHPLADLEALPAPMVSIHRAIPDFTRPAAGAVDSPLERTALALVQRRSTAPGPDVPVKVAPWGKTLPPEIAQCALCDAAGLVLVEVPYDPESNTPEHRANLRCLHDAAAMASSCQRHGWRLLGPAGTAARERLMAELPP